MAKGTSKRFRQRINTDMWSVILRAPQEKGWVGSCDYEKERIYIDPALLPRDLVRTALHEFLHAELPDHKDTVIERIAQECERYLHRLGVKLHD